MGKYYVDIEFATFFSTTVEAESLEEAMQKALDGAEETPKVTQPYMQKPRVVEVSEEVLDENMQPLVTWDDDGNRVRYPGRCLKKDWQEWVAESTFAFLEEGRKRQEDSKEE